MKLIKAQVQKYRSIRDTGIFDVDPKKTILVGPNEAGKTAILQALQQINPPAGAKKFDALRDYPRSEYNDITKRALRWEGEGLEYRRSSQPRPKLGPYLATLEAWLEAEERLPSRGQRTAQRIYEALCVEGYTAAVIRCADRCACSSGAAIRWLVLLSRSTLRLARRISLTSATSTWSSAVSGAS